MAFAARSATALLLSLSRAAPVHCFAPSSYSRSSARSAAAFGAHLVERKAPRAVLAASFRLKMTTASSSSNNDVNDDAAATTNDATPLAPTPPTPRREEDRVVLAGLLTPNDVGYADSKGKPLVRQSDSSKKSSPLLDPPVPVSDPYGWLRNEGRDDQEVLEHLKAENSYTERLTAHLSGLRTDLYEEMLSGIRETDHTAPAPKGEYAYYSRTYEGKSYKSLCRAPLPKEDIGTEGGSSAQHWIAEQTQKWDGTREAPVLPGEVSYLDVNELAVDRTYCATGQVRTSPNAELVAYTVDFSGDEVCGLYVKDIATGETIDHDPALECYGALQWGADDTTLFYLKIDEQKRPYQLWRRTIGGGGSSDDTVPEDELLYEEPDELYWVGLSKSFDSKYIFVSSRSKETSEVHFLDLDDPAAKLQCVAQRRQKVLYSVKHRADKWYITSNVGGTSNMRLMVSPAVADSEENWQDMVDEHGKVMFDGGYDRSISGLTSFASHSVATGREGGLPQVWVLTYADSDSSDVTDFVQLEFDEDAYDVGLGANLDCTAESVTIAYDSLVTPPSQISIPLTAPMDLAARTVLKEATIPGYDKSLYACERTTVKSRDGTADIPVSLVYRKDVMQDKVQAGETVPTHLYGYGSYGATMEASFRTTRRTLLDRGMVYVIAHVRGGGEMGRPWYEEPNGAKFLCKQNTFDDFVDVARWLIDDRKMTTPEQLSCEGRSAGGLLIGAAINQAPELFKMALLGVPFLDVVCTMIDASIPLTVVEWEEWGNPNEKRYHDYMMEYSPINNIQHGAKYPACLLTGGLHDPRVQYWEPAKHAAELRYQQDSAESGPICLKIDMAAGHFSASDRYKYLRELSFDYAFLLDQLGLTGGSK